MLNKYNVYDNGEICMYNVTATEITKTIGIRCNAVSVYAIHGTIYDKRYSFVSIADDNAKKGDIDGYFKKEWDKARFRINKNAKRSSQYDF